MKIKIIDYSNGNLLIPHRAHYNDAGADVYCPIEYTLKPGESKAIALGIGIEIPDGFMGIIYPRSSMAKRGVVCEVPPIDSGYRGEIHAIITNHSSSNVTLEAKSRIGQLVIQPIIISEFVTEFGDERGDGGLGSTGR